MPKKVLALAGDELICTGIRDMDSFVLLLRPALLNWTRYYTTD